MNILPEHKLLISDVRQNGADPETVGGLTLLQHAIDAEIDGHADGRAAIR
jgi:hypothetical protein